jgi:hypothetical protein
VKTAVGGVRGVLPFLAVLVYVISPGKGMAERAAAQQQPAQEQFDSYVRSVATTGDAAATPADQLAGPRSCWTPARSTRPSSTACRPSARLTTRTASPDRPDLTRVG